MDNSPLRIEIHLLPDNDTRHLFRPAKVENLFVHHLDHFKRLPVGDRVDENVAVHANGVFRGEERVLVLPLSARMPRVNCRHDTSMIAHLSS